MKDRVLTDIGAKEPLTDWSSIDWKKIKKRVKNLRQRIYRAGGLSGLMGKLSRSVLRGGEHGDVLPLTRQEGLRCVPLMNLLLSSGRQEVSCRSRMIMTNLIDGM